MENPLDDVPRIKALTDPAERAREAGRVLNEMPRAMTELKEVRRAAVLELREQGLSHQKIAELIGVSRNRAANIAAGLS